MSSLRQTPYFVPIWNAILGVARVDEEHIRIDNEAALMALAFAAGAIMSTGLPKDASKDDVVDGFHQFNEWVTQAFNRSQQIGPPPGLPVN